MSRYLPILLLVVLAAGCASGDGGIGTVVTTNAAGCFENSPERRGQVGCSIVADKALSDTISDPVYWHIAKFPSITAAEAAATPDEVAVDAHGSAWVLGVSKDPHPHGSGVAVATI